MVPPYRNRIHSMRRPLKHLRDGGAVCIFPEGRIASGEQTALPVAEVVELLLARDCGSAPTYRRLALGMVNYLI